jgi:Exostosin family
MQIISSPKTLNAILESGFIQNVLFRGTPFSTTFDPQRASGEIVIYLELYEINLELIKKIKNAGKKIVLYHMGDELGDKNISAYALCDLIIRNYFFSQILNEPKISQKILWVPNGYKTGIGPRTPNTLQQISSRQFLASFLGWLSNIASFNGERSLFAEAVSAWTSTKKRRAKTVWHWLSHYISFSREYLTFTKVAPICKTDLHLLSSNGFSNGYNVGLYSAVMEDSIFAPCPAGNSPETIRLYDALECGCIPVTLEHEFITSQQALGEFGLPPFCFLKSWDEFPKFLERMKQQLASNPDEIQQMQKDCTAWWENYKKQIAKKITSRIESLA